MYEVLSYARIAKALRNVRPSLRHQSIPSHNPATNVLTVGWPRDPGRGGCGGFCLFTLEGGKWQVTDGEEWERYVIQMRNGKPEPIANMNRGFWMAIGMREHVATDGDEDVEGLRESARVELPRRNSSELEGHGPGRPTDAAS
jgi:hypothetical protein